MLADLPQLFSKDAEEAVIGAVLVNPAKLYEVELEADDFFIHRHRFIWEAINHLDRKGAAIDIMTVVDELDRSKKLEETGGPAYLVQVANATYTTLHAKEYADIVRSYAKRRRWKSLGEEIVRAAFDMSTDLDDAGGQFVKQMVSAGQVAGGAQHISVYNQQLRDRVAERKADPKEIWGIPTGFHDYDRVTGGVQKSEVLLISAEPGVGKSTLAVQMGYQMAGCVGPDGAPIPNVPQVQRPGAIYSLEMRGLDVQSRTASTRSGVTTRKLNTGMMTDEEFDGFLAAMDYLDTLPVWLSDATHWTTLGLRSDVARLKAQHGIEWIIVDYLYLMQDGMSRGLSETDRTTIISAGLKAVAKAEDVAVIAIHSKNKAGDLRGSKQVEFDGDVIMFMEPDQNSDIVNCVIKKGRNIDNHKKMFPLLRRPAFPQFLNVVEKAVDQYGRGYQR